MLTIDVDSITILPDRQRQTFDAKSIETLAESFTRVGQLHPVVLEVVPKEGEVPQYILRAGERRTRAAKLLKARGETFLHDGKSIPPGHIAYTRTSDLSQAELYELELEENIQRVDLTWQERATAMSNLMNLHALRAGKDISIAQFSREVTGLDTPVETAPFRVKATDALAVAKHLSDPDVAAAKSQKEALNIVKRKNEAILREELGRKLASAGFGTSAASGHVLLEGSAFEHVRNLPSNHFDIILTDPPYGIDMDQMKTQSGSDSGHVHDYQDSADYAAECIRLVAEEGYRVTKASAACYMFCDLRFFAAWKRTFESAGWYVWPNPIFWDKTPTGSLLGTANGPRHVYETILYAIKGGKGVNTVGNDIIRIPGPAQDKRHPAEKPVELYEHLLGWSATPGDRILDFFCGCGPIFPAASSYQCTATGIEQNAGHISSSKLRLTSNSLL